MGPDGSIVAVHAFGRPFMYGDMPFYDDAARDAQARAEALLAEIDPETVGPVALERRAAVADALVHVALRGRGRDRRGLARPGRFRAALGSVSHSVLHEAEGPVVGVPPAAPAARPDVEEGVAFARQVRGVPPGVG